MHKESPGGETGTIQKDQSGGRSTVILADPVDSPAFDAQLLANNPQARAVDWNAYQRGYLDGIEYAKENLVDVEQAQLAVRLFQAAQEDEERVRRDMAHTRDFFDVERCRDEQRDRVRGYAA